MTAGVCSEVTLVALFEVLLHRWAGDLPLKSPLETGALAAHLKVIAALSARLAQAAEDACFGRFLFPSSGVDEDAASVEGLVSALRAHLRTEVSGSLSEENLRLQQAVLAAERRAASGAEEGRRLRAASEGAEIRAAGLLEERRQWQEAADAAQRDASAQAEENRKLQQAVGAAEMRALAAECEVQQLRSGPAEAPEPLSSFAGARGGLQHESCLNEIYEDCVELDDAILPDVAAGAPLSGADAAASGAATERSRNISVAVRLKPGLPGASVDWAQEEGDASSLKDLRTGEAWRFDRVLGPGASTPHLFEACGRDVVESFCSGVNGTILTYGQTASGKTYTMQGDKRVKGVIQLAVDCIFARLSLQEDVSFTLSVSYLEIYNEHVYDLLGETMTEVRVFEHARGDVELQNLTRRRVEGGAGDVLECLEVGSRRRRVGETQANDRSSRSHTVLQINLQSQKHGDGSVRLSQLNLVDLAGSESTKTTGATGKRLREGQNINRSLLALSQVVATLSDTSQALKSARIGFRDSKLTRILQQSIGGNAQTALICTISTAEANYWESRRSLDFAGRAKRIRNRVSTNVFKLSECRPDELLKLRAENEQLRMHVTTLSSKLGEAQAGSTPEQGLGVGAPRRETLGDVTNRPLAVLQSSSQRCGVGRKRADSFGGISRPAFTH